MLSRRALRRMAKCKTTQLQADRATRTRAARTELSPRRAARPAACTEAACPHSQGPRGWRPAPGRPARPPAPPAAAFRSRSVSFLTRTGSSWTGQILHQSHLLAPGKRPFRTASSIFIPWMAKKEHYGNRTANWLCTSPSCCSDFWTPWGRTTWGFSWLSFRISHALSVGHNLVSKEQHLVLGKFYSFLRLKHRCIYST